MVPDQYGKYELLERIGQGGMAEVYKARLAGAAGFERTVVIKRMLPHVAARPDAVKMFIHEAKLASAIHHKSVVQIFELGQGPDGEYFIAMEYVAGSDLRGLLKTSTAEGRRIPPWFSVQILIEVLEGLDCVHTLYDENGSRRRVVHRDVSPSNIFISFTGEVKLGDFGVAKDSARDAHTRTGALKGKIGYMPPEQLRGLPLDGRCDVFAAGVVLWECLTQRRLFRYPTDMLTMEAICQADRPPPSSYEPGLPRELDAIVQDALAPDPEQRIFSAREFINRLDEVMPKLKPRVRPQDVAVTMRALLAPTTREPVQAPEPTEFDTPELDGVSAGPSSSPPRSIATPAELGELLATPGMLERVEGSSSSADRFLALDIERMLALPEGPRVTLPPLRPPPSPRPSVADEIGAFLAEPIPSPLPTAPQNLARMTVATALNLRPSSPGPPPPLARETELAEAVAAAVRSAHDDVVITSHQEGRPEHPLLEGIEFHKHANKLAELAAGTWAHQGILGDEYTGAHPFWMRDADKNRIGPCAFRQALYLLKAEAKHGRSLELSADGKHWMTAATFAALSGQVGLLDPSIVTPSFAPKRGQPQGTLEAKSLTALFGWIVRDQLTGRLVIGDEVGGNYVWRELQVLRGVAVGIESSAESMQLPQMLLERKIIHADYLPELMHEVVLSAEPLESVVGRRGQIDAAQFRPMLLRDRLLEMFGWRHGRYLFDPTPPPATQPFTRSLLAAIPELILRTMSIDELRAVTLRYLETRLEVSERFGSTLPQMSLAANHAEIAQRFTKGKKLSALLKANPEQEKPILMLAYLLVEVGLLLTPIAT